MYVITAVRAATSQLATFFVFPQRFNTACSIHGTDAETKFSTENLRESTTGNLRADGKVTLK
jgi:hypothetical protein